MAVTFYRNQSAADTETYVYSTAPQYFPEIDTYDSPMYEWEKAGNSFFGWSTNRNASDSRGLHQPLEMDSPPVDGESYYAIWTDLVGTTWTLDDSPDLGYSLSVDMAFTSNDIAFEAYSSGYDDYTSFGISGIGYANSGGWTIAYDAYNGGWANNAYKTITITANNDAEYCRPLISFLVYNATQYIPATPYMTNDAELTSIADAIRTKGGTVAPLVYPAGFVSAINDIPSGGSSSYTVTIILADPISPSDFQNCIIYDGQGQSATQIGTISSPTGRATVTTTTGMIVVQFFGSYVETPACSNVDGVLCDNTIGLIYGGDHDIGLAVIGDGEVTIRKVDYDA